MSKKQKIIDYKNELKYALDIMHEQSRFAETKNASMIVFTSALFIGLLSNVDNIKELIFYNGANHNALSDYGFYLFIIFSFFTFAVSFFYSMQAFFPKISQPSIERNGKNILFFDTNTSFSNSKELYKYYKKKYKNKSEFEKDLSNQILNLSKIAKWKYDCFKKSLSVLWKGELLSFGIFMIIFFIGKGTV